MARYCSLAGAVIAALALVVIPVVFAQGQAAPKTPPRPLEWRLTSPSKTSRAVLDKTRGQIVIDGDITFVSPKSPPYRLEVSCNHLVANGLANSSTTVVKASREVRLTALIEPKPDAAAPPESRKPTRYEGTAELVVYEMATDPATKTTSPVIRMLTAKNARGVEVKPALTMDNPPVRGEGTEIAFNLDTGDLILDRDLVFEDLEAKP